MENGHPLTDEDRWPWLDAIARQISEQYSSGAGGVFSSSALKEIYRQRLKVIPEDQISWIYLHAPKSVLQERLEQRKGHFFDPALLDSQFETLEPPAYGVHQDVSGSIAEIMNELLVQIT